MPHRTSPASHTQQHLGTYLLLEMQHRQQSLTDLAQHTGTCPSALREVLHGRARLTPQLIHPLASLWEITPGLLWHWQQDIDVQELALQANAS